MPFLDSIGFLGPDVLHAHCVQLSEEDCHTLARNGGVVFINFNAAYIDKKVSDAFVSLREPRDRASAAPPSGRCTAG